MKSIFYFHWKSPIGHIVFLGNEKGLLRIEIISKPIGPYLSELRARFHIYKNLDPFENVVDWVREYFQGKDQAFSGSLHFQTGTLFQKRVWESLLTIPFGSVQSYKWLAQKVSNPKAMRAVGQANGKNPFPILIPCHRVICQDQFLGGYTGGIWIKHKLLELEGWSIQDRRVIGKGKGVFHGEKFNH